MSKTTNMGLQLVESYINGPQARLYNHNLWLIDEKLQEGIDSRFQKVDELPETGEKGVIYLVPSELHQEDDICDEYVWSVDDERFELIGSTKINTDALLGTSYFFKIDFDISTNDNTQELGSFKVYERVYDNTLRHFVDTELYSTTSTEASDDNREIYLYLLKNVVSTNKNNVAEIRINISSSGGGSSSSSSDVYYTPVYLYFAGLKNKPEEETVTNSVKIVPENIRYFDGYFDIYATGLILSEHFNYPSKIDEIESDLNDNYYTKTEVDSELASKQDTLTFDTTPTEDSTDPVTSDGIYKDIHTKIINDTESAAVKTLNTTPLPFNSLKVGIEAKQDLHGYDKPWAGGAGANKWNEQWEVGGIQFDIGKDAPSTTQIRSLGYIAVEPSTTYYFVLGNLIGYGNIFQYTSDKTYLGQRYIISNTSRGVFTTDEYCHYIRFTSSSTYGTTYNNDIAVNYPPSVKTYSPYANECPITGWDAVNLNECGKNLYDKTAIDTNKGFIAGKWINQTGNTFSYGGWSVSEYIRVDGEKTAISGMTVDGQVSSGRGGYCCYDKYKNVLGGGVYNALTQIVTLPTDTAYIRISVWDENKDVCQLEYGSTATPYEAYNGTTYTETLATTNYGGYWDVKEGEIGGENQYYNLSEMTFTLSSNGEYYWVLGEAPFAQAVGKGISSHFDVTDESLIRIGITSTTGHYVLFFKNVIDEMLGISSVSEFNAWLQAQATNGTPVQLVYPIATPTTTSTTPRLIKANDGVTNLWADSGKIEKVGYYSGNNAANELLSTVNGLLETKADTSNTYTKSEIDAMIGDISSAIDEINGEEV